MENILNIAQIAWNSITIFLVIGGVLIWVRLKKFTASLNLGSIAKVIDNVEKEDD